MDGLQIAGLILIVAGVVWFFLIGRPWEKPPQVKGRALKGGWAWLKPILDWIAEHLPKPYLPGAFLIVAGVLLLGIGTVTGDGNGNGNGNGTTTTTTTSG